MTIFFWLPPLATGSFRQKLGSLPTKNVKTEGVVEFVAQKSIIWPLLFFLNSISMNFSKNWHALVLDLLLRVGMTMHAICEKPHNLTVLDLRDSPRLSMYTASLPNHWWRFWCDRLWVYQWWIWRNKDHWLLTSVLGGHPSLCNQTRSKSVFKRI